MRPLSSNPNLKAIQEYVRELEIERGFEGNTVQQACILLGEEIGELFKAVRKHEKMQMDQTSLVGSVEEELADVLIYVCSIANRFDIELEQAFGTRKK